jgi:hypothetical protein
MVELEFQAKADRARKLTATFLQKQGGSPLQPGNIQILLCNPPSGPRKKQEADAVERLLCGIEWAEEEVWVSVLIGWKFSDSLYLSQKPLFDGITAEIPNILANHQDRSEECDREVNRLNRLLKRHEVMVVLASKGLC